MGKYDYIKLKYNVQPNEMICERCNDNQVMPLGSMRYSIMKALMKAFFDIHKKCIKIKNKNENNN